MPSPLPSFCRSVICAALLSLLGNASAQTPRSPDHALPPGVARALQQAGLPAQAFHALVVPVNTQGAAVLQVQAQQPVNPASVMKLVTTFAAIDLLGQDFTWRTGFLTDGQVSGGALRGNLYVRGDGDPKLVLERLQDAFLALQNQGVQVVLGDIVLDQSAFALPARDPHAFDGEGLRPYNAAPEALLVNFKSVILKFVPNPAKGVADVISEPPLAGLQIDATVPLRKGGCGDWRSALDARFDDPNAIRFTGRYPGSCGESTWPVAYQDPASYAERAIEGLWRASGGAITGRVRTGPTPPKARLLHEALSLPLSDIIADVNQWSNNVMAQQVFLTLGRLPANRVLEATVPTGRLVLPAVGRFERSRERLNGWWKQRFGAQVPAPVLDNGSGLSRQERITPEALATMLRQAAVHPQSQMFVSSLAVAGESGTARRLANGQRDAARGRAQVKTGTLRDVSGIAGYVTTGSGARYVVVGFINHPEAGKGRPALEALLNWTADLP